MEWKALAKHPITRLTISGFSIVGGVLAAALIGDEAEKYQLLIKESLSALGGLGTEAIGSLMDEAIKSGASREEVLKNGDLTRAVGKAILLGFLEEAEKTDDENDKKILLQIGHSDPVLWEEIVLGLEADVPLTRIDQATLNDLLANNLTQYFKTKEGKIDELTALENAEEWRDIVVNIFGKKGLYPSIKGVNQVLNSLHLNFPRYLRKTLAKDFEDNGAAFASMQLRLSGEILEYSKANYHESKINRQKLDTLLVRVNELRWLNNTKKIALDEKFWKEAFDLNKSTLENVTDLLTRVDAVKRDTEEILKILKEDRIPEPRSTNFYPKNFPERLTYFTGREIVLGKITEALKTKGTAALAETHGVGKSSVMIEFAHRNKDDFKHILFIRATTNEFDTFVSEIGNSLGFALPNDATPAQRLSVLQDWLNKNDNWLLLVDNVDDVAFIKQCHFNQPTGKVIYTSNDEQIYQVGTAVKLPKMTNENAMLLLYKHWQNEAEARFEDIPDKYHATLKGIAEKFGNHPFSMAFVGSYLADEDESLEEFLNAYQSKEKNLLANYKFLNNYQHQEVATAFLIRFEQISKPNVEDAREDFLSIAVQDYLKLSAFIGTDDIPEELLQQSLALLHPDESEFTNDTNFIKDIYRRFKPTSIFKRDAENKTLNTHRIVQEIMRFQINNDEDLLLSTLADVLSNNFMVFDFTNKEIVERYLPHVGIFLEYLEKNKPDKTVNLKLENESTGTLCNNYAFYFDLNGDYTKAESFYLCFKEISEKIEGIEQTRLATSYNNLALLYYSQGKFDEAELYYLKDLAIYEKVKGENHPDTATSYNNLAGLYQSQGKFEESERYFLKALDIREKVMGANHQVTAASYNNLAGIYYSQGRYEEAEPYCLKSLEILEKVLGENHPSTATSYNNLAKIYYSQERYEEAKPYCLKSLEIYEKVLGENHPDTALSYNNLADLYHSQKRHEEAELYYLKALGIYKKVLGENHPDTANSYNNLAPLYESQGRYEEAELYHLKALGIHEKVLGENHPSTANSYNNLGVFYANQGDFPKAKEYLENALKIWLVKLDNEHPNTKKAKESLQILDEMIKESGK